MPELCHCGKPLHYTDPRAEAYMHSIVARLGPTIPVRVEQRVFLVQRHYIALHGLKAAELPLLGFKEVTHETQH